jgi:large subunit ribosomal protein L40
MSLLRPASTKAAALNGLRGSPSTAGSIRFYAAKPDMAGDPKRETIRRVLYPANRRNRPSPVGTWRPDVARALQSAIPSVQAHETIERAWLLHKRHVRKEREAELARKFAKMEEAMDELYRLDSRLFLEANRSDDPRAKSAQEMELAKKLKMSEVKTLESRIPGLFPRELKVPTETPSRTGWNYEYKPFPRPL